MTSVASSPFDAEGADIVLRSSDQEPVDFRVYKNILALSSPFWSTTFCLPQGSASSNGGTVQDIVVHGTERKDNTPVIIMSEGANVIDALLRYLYPGDSPSFTSLDDLKDVLEAAYKYDMLSSLSSLRQALLSPSFLEEHPVRVYAVAVHYRLHNEAKIASRHTLKVNIAEVEDCEELDRITASDFLRLLRLHRQRAEQMVAILFGHWAMDVCYSCGSWKESFRTQARLLIDNAPDLDPMFEPQFILTIKPSMCGTCSVMEGLAELRKNLATLEDTI